MSRRARRSERSTPMLARIAVLIVGATCAFGCAGGARVTIPDVDRIRAELPALEARAAAQPDDAKAQANYGLALHALDQDSAALAPLERAADLDPSDISTALALGSAYEAELRDDDALRLYERAKPKGRGDRKLIDAARAAVERQRLSRQMKALAAREAEVDVSRIPESTLAVTSFEPGSGAEGLDGLGKALSVVVATELAQLPGIALVEREKLQALLDEMTVVRSEESTSPPETLDAVTETRGVQQRLARISAPSNGVVYYAGELDGKPSKALRLAVQSFQRDHDLTADGVVGPRTAAALEAAFQALNTATEKRSANEMAAAPRAGRLLGARRLLGGRYFAPDQDQIAVDARIEDTVTGELVGEVLTRRPRASFHEMTGDLVIQTAEALSLPITPEDRRRILSLPPATRNLGAFLAFGHAVDLEERGLYDQAAKAYGQAVRLDPQFAAARQKSEVLSVGSAAFQQSIDQTLRLALQRVGTGGRATMAGALGMVGTGVEENAPRDDRADGMNRTAQAEGAPTGQARVRGQIPVGGRP